MNALVLALFLALAPAVIGAEPSVQSVLRAYQTAGWIRVQAEDGPYVCINQAGSDYVDELVGWLAKRAALVKGL